MPQDYDFITMIKTPIPALLIFYGN